METSKLRDELLFKLPESSHRGLSDLLWLHVMCCLLLRHPSPWWIQRLLTAVVTCLSLSIVNQGVEGGSGTVVDRCVRLSSWIYLHIKLRCCWKWRRMRLVQGSFSWQPYGKLLHFVSPSMRIDWRDNFDYRWMRGGCNDVSSEKSTNVKKRSDNIVRGVMLDCEDDQRDREKKEQEEDDSDGEASARYNIINNCKGRTTSNPRCKSSIISWTGRRHQLRIHLIRVAGSPILGDVAYTKGTEDRWAVECACMPKSWWYKSLHLLRKIHL